MDLPDRSASGRAAPARCKSGAHAASSLRGDLTLSASQVPLLSPSRYPPCSFCWHLPPALPTVADVTADPYTAWATDVRAQLLDWLGAAYGRDWDPEARRRTATLRAAGYGICGEWWSLIEALDVTGTTYAAERQRARLDAMLADLLLWPDDSPDVSWAERYGFLSASAAGRAFRRNYELDVRAARRLGRLFHWLVCARHEARSADSIARRAEAIERLQAGCSRLLPHLGPKAEAAFRLMESGAWPPEGTPRPRYPARGRDESPKLALAVAVAVAP